jgi:hypothetical protein
VRRQEAAAKAAPRPAATGIVEVRAGGPGTGRARKPGPDPPHLLLDRSLDRSLPSPLTSPRSPPIHLY